VWLGSKMEAKNPRQLDEEGKPTNFVPAIKQMGSQSVFWDLE